MLALPQGHLVDKAGNALLGVLAGSVKLVGLGSSAVIVGNGLKSTSDVNNVDGLELLLPVVGGENIGSVGDGVEETVLNSVHGGRTDDGGLGEDLAGLNLGLSLGSEVLGVGLGVGVVGGDVDETVNIVLGNGLDDALGSLNVDILVGEVPMRFVRNRKLRWVA